MLLTGLNWNGLGPRRSTPGEHQGYSKRNITCCVMLKSESEEEYYVVPCNSVQVITTPGNLVSSSFSHFPSFLLLPQSISKFIHYGAKGGRRRQEQARRDLFEVLFFRPLIISPRLHSRWDYCLSISHTFTIWIDLLCCLWPSFYAGIYYSSLVLSMHW